MIAIKNFRRLIKVGNKFIPTKISIYFKDNVNIKEVDTLLKEILVDNIFSIKDIFLQRYDDFLLKVEFPKFYRAKTPATGKESFEEYIVVFICKKVRKIIRKYLGLRLIGISACPCALEEIKNYIKNKYKENFDERTLNLVLSEVPVTTHNQRTLLEILIEIKSEDISYEKILNDLLKIARNSLSSETYEVLKRKDEVEVVLKLSRNTNFVEDIIRKAALNIVKVLKNMPDDCLVKIKVLSLESIHKHDAYASKKFYIGEIKKILKY